MERYCCYIDNDAPVLNPDKWSLGKEPCQNPAEWIIIVPGSAPDDYTEACTAHVGMLLTNAPEHRVFPIVREA